MHTNAAVASRLFATDGYYPNQSNVLRMLGYFSLVGLLRVHSLVGDYHSALKAAYPINFNERTHLFAPKIAGCNIALYYYAGFCYMMLRRWVGLGGWVHHLREVMLAVA